MLAEQQTPGWPTSAPVCLIDVVPRGAIESTRDIAWGPHIVPTQRTAEVQVLLDPLPQLRVLTESGS